MVPALIEEVNKTKGRQGSSGEEVWVQVTCARVEDLRGIAVEFQDYKIVLYRQEDRAWVAEVPAISGCYALMPTREKALAELSKVFQMISEEYREKDLPLPADTTEIVHA